MIDLYRNIRKFRIEHKMSQDTLAKLTGYTSRSSIAKIEKGEVDLPLSKIEAFALQKQISELMKERRKLYRNDSEDSGKARLSEINEELKNLRKEVRMTVRIEKHSLEIEERLRKAEEQNQNEKRVEHKEKESQEVR